MNIGLVCPYSLDVPGGVQNQVLGLAGHFSRHGDRVAVIAPGTPSKAQLFSHGLRAEQFTSAGRGVGIRYNGSVARVNPTPRAAARVRQWLSGHNFDVLHVHEPLIPSIGLSAVKHAQVPVVATFHTAMYRSRLLRLAGSLFAGCIDKITTVIAVSDAARDVVREYYGRDPMIIPNGFRRADFTSPEVRQPLHHTRVVEDRSPRIVFLGRLNEPRKGLSVLLAALPELSREHPGLEVVIAGQGHCPGRKQHRHAPGMSVQVVGQISDAERAALLADADLFIAPHTERESFGIVLLEAMAAGTTVVASDLAPFTNLLTGRTGPLGFCFPAGDPAGLTSTVERALCTDRAPMNERAQAATTRFDWATVGAQVREAYRAASGGGARHERWLRSASTGGRGKRTREPELDPVSLGDTEMRRIGR